MTPIVLFRRDIDMEGELATAEAHLRTVDSRVLVPDDSLVVGRYSVLPWYEELERDLKHRNSVLLNSYRQHKFVADLMGWGGEHGVLSGLTPRSWPNWARLPEGAYVVKSRTNSRKQEWNRRMFCPTRDDVPKVAMTLLEDDLIRDQGVVVREYVPLRRLDTGLNGLPISNEWRTFFLTTTAGPKMLARGFYWRASHPDAEATASWCQRAEAVANEAAARVCEHVNFFVLDVAETETGDWIVIEVNDGQMSGLCGCSAHELYENLRRGLPAVNRRQLRARRDVR